MITVRLRYNTEAGDGPWLWRLLIDGEEVLARQVTLHVTAVTTTDVLPDGRVKHHLTAVCTSVKESDGCYELRRFIPLKLVAAMPMHRQL